jgi:hypothetical protein
MMVRFWTYLVLGLTLSGLSSCREVEDNPMEKEICSRYEAMCPEDILIKRVSGDCDAVCEKQVSGEAAVEEACVFMACGVEVGKCDNEEYGDPSILACLKDNGWLDDI